MATRSVDVVLHNFKTLLILVLINARLSYQTLLTISRRVDGDIFNVSSPLLCSDRICDPFGAELISEQLKLSSSCSCQCKRTFLDPVSTFYEKTSKCLTDKMITDYNGCTIMARDKTTYSSLIALNASMTSPMELILEDKNFKDSALQHIKVTKWSYYQNNAWYDGIEDLFSVTFQPSLLGSNTGKLKISNKIPKALSGGLLKVSIDFKFSDKFNSKGCLMFKVLGTYKVVPTTSPPTTVKPTTVIEPVTKSPSISTTGVTTDEIVNPVKPNPNPTTTTLETSASPTVPKKPNDNAISGKRERLLIAIATGSVTLLVVLLLVCIGACLFVRRQRRRNKKKDTIKACTRPSLPRPAEPTSPPHDYEYVVYPALTNSLPPGKATSLDNAMYGRGPDNELLIRTPAVSMESLISKHASNSTKSNHSTLPHPHDYTPLETSVANESNSIYQPLIRPNTPQDSVKIENKKADSEKSLSNHDGDHDKSTDEDFEYEVQPRDEDCERGDDDNDNSERPKTFLEPSNDEVQEYMELEPVTSYSTTV